MIHTHTNRGQTECNWRSQAANLGNWATPGYGRTVKFEFFAAKMAFASKARKFILIFLVKLGGSGNQETFV